MSQQRENTADEWQEPENTEPEQLSFVPIDSFQENIHPANLEKPVPDTPKQTNTAEGFSDELPEDDGTSLEFEIEAEQENQDNCCCQRSSRSPRSTNRSASSIESTHLMSPRP